MNVLISVLLSLELLIFSCLNCRKKLFHPQMQRMHRSRSVCSRAAARAPDMTLCQVSANVSLHLTKCCCTKLFRTTNLATIKRYLFFLIFFFISARFCTTTLLANHVGILDKQRKTAVSIQSPGTFRSGMPAANKSKYSPPLLGPGSLFASSQKAKLLVRSGFLLTMMENAIISVSNSRNNMQHMLQYGQR